MAAPSRPNQTYERLGWTLQPTSTDLSRLTFLGRYPIRVRPELADATAAVEEALIASGYENPCDYVGSWMYRAITGTGGLASAHAYAVAIDIDYGGDTDGDGDPTIDRNPHIHRPIVPGDPGFGVEWQILEHQVEKIEAIRNVDGDQIWRWLGWAIGDTMHIDVLVGPAACTVDWSTVYTGQEDDMISWYDWVQGYVEGLAEDPAKTEQEFHRLNTVPAGDGGYILEPADTPSTVAYWVDMLNDPANPEWRGFLARTSLSTWGR